MRVNGCCCFNLRGAGLAHGWIGLLLGFLSVGNAIMRIVNFDPNAETFLDGYQFYEHYDTQNTLNKEIASMVILMIDTLVSAMLLIGIINNQSCMLLPWIILRGIGLVILVPLTVLLFFLITFSGRPEALIVSLVVAFITGLLVWSWVVIYSLYHEIRSINKRPIAMHIPPQHYIERGQVDAPPQYQMFDK